jgi:hypothetical protein
MRKRTRGDSDRFNNMHTDGMPRAVDGNDCDPLALNDPFNGGNSLELDFSSNPLL